MAKTYTGETSATVYRRQLEDLALCPEHIVTVRDRPTREFLNVITEIEDPRARCQIVPGRKLNPWLAMSEGLWLLAGRYDVASLLPYNKRITDFSDDGMTMYGAYGARMSAQIEDAIRRLQVSDTDRRAVLQIWSSLDLTATTKDPPCNTQVMFKVRDNRLYMTVTCRSNDLHWGLHAVNLMQFGILQEYVACRLGVEMGTQTHFSNSLHIYTDKQGRGITQRMIAEIDTPIEELPADAWLFPNPWPENINHATFVASCGAALDGELTDQHWSCPFLEFAEDFLRVYREKASRLIRHQKMFDGWMKMAHEYAPELFR